MIQGAKPAGLFRAEPAQGLELQFLELQVGLFAFELPDIPLRLIH